MKADLYTKIKFDGKNYNECYALIKGWFYGGNVQVFLCEGGSGAGNVVYSNLDITYPVLSDSNLKANIKVLSGQTIHVLNYTGWPRLEVTND